MRRINYIYIIIIIIFLVLTSCNKDIIDEIIKEDIIYDNFYMESKETIAREKENPYSNRLIKQWSNNGVSRVDIYKDGEIESTSIYGLDQIEYYLYKTDELYIDKEKEKEKDIKNTSEEISKYNPRNRLKYLMEVQEDREIEYIGLEDIDGRESKYYRVITDNHFNDELKDIRDIYIDLEYGIIIKDIYKFYGRIGIPKDNIMTYKYEKTIDSKEIIKFDISPDMPKDIFQLDITKNTKIINEEDRIEYDQIEKIELNELEEDILIIPDSSIYRLDYIYKDNYGNDEDVYIQEYIDRTGKKAFSITSHKNIKDFKNTLENDKTINIIDIRDDKGYTNLGELIYMEFVEDERFYHILLHKDMELEELKNIANSLKIR